MKTPEPYKRWYDRQPKLAQAVRVLMLFPDEIKGVISEGIMLIANREFVTDEDRNSVRTLGSEKIMGLHKSKNKRREYDQAELPHKAMNYLYILSNENQDFMAEHILKMVQYIQQYLSTCRVFQAEPTVEHIAELTDMYIKMGSDKVEEFLNKLREEFFHRMLAAKDIVPPEDFLENIVMDEMQGLKLRVKD